MEGGGGDIQTSGLAGLRAIALRVGLGRRLRRKRKVKDQLMELWHKMIFPVRRAWLAVSTRVKARKNGGGLLKLHDDVQTCEYDDVHRMWNMMLSRSESEHGSQHTKRKHRPFWRVFVWSNHNSSSSFSAKHA